MRADEAFERVRGGGEISSPGSWSSALLSALQVV
jgi:hypothetical protein